MKVLVLIKHQGAADSTAWTEKLTVKSEESAEQEIKDVIASFNNSLKPGEKPREFVEIEEFVTDDDEVFDDIDLYDDIDDEDDLYDDIDDEDDLYDDIDDEDDF